MKLSIALSALLVAGFMTATTEPASAVVYCQHTDYAPQGQASYCDRGRLRVRWRRPASAVSAHPRIAAARWIASAALIGPFLPQ